ncbi:preprotein translocase subunit YajC [Terriglobus albidus]|uniref:preprotein translocase subunit YajC n=1 Tax=Terriglobus albidus TaxID=1592106 RepID=UPI00295ABE33|nr:preprotein translocase subunit YajC [Terriglobus albidus]
MTVSAPVSAMILQNAQGSSLVTMLPIVLMIAVFYFLLILPNQRKQKKWQQMLGDLKAGDRVTTSGGIKGVILSVKDDSLILRVAPDNLKLEFAKSAIASVTTGEEEK